MKMTRWLTVVWCAAVIFAWAVAANAGFVDNSNGTVTDTSTGLMWQQDTARDGQGNYDTMTWKEALNYCENLELPEGGYTDWRLPTIKELASLVDASRYNPAINIGFFPNTISLGYWSSTTSAGSTDLAWLVGFGSGGVTWYYKTYGSDYVRAVRGGQSGAFDYSIISTAGTGGTISPSGTVNLNSGESVTFTVTPDSGYVISDVKVDGASQGAISTYTFSNVTRDHAIAASFAAAALFGNLTVTITPQGAIDGGAQWRVDTGAWHESGATRSGLAPGGHTLEFKNIIGWNRPANQLITLIADQTARETGTYTSAPPDQGVIEGYVTSVNTKGQILVPLAGVTVEVSGQGSGSTDVNGHYSVTGVEAGTHKITASKIGYYSVIRSVGLTSGESKTEIFRLTQDETTDHPAVVSFESPNGKHFVEGMTQDLTFKADVAWGGAAGSVRFKVGGEWVNAEITPSGIGLAQASLTVAAPNVLETCTELEMEIINGEGKVTRRELGVHFSPIFGYIPWYEDNILWTPSGLTLSFSEEKSWSWDLPWKIGSAEFHAFLGFGHQFKYDLLSATLNGSLAGKGGIGFKVPTAQPKLKVLGEADIAITGALAISMAGCNIPEVIPSWSLSFTGKPGIEAPVVFLLDGIVPGAGTTLANVPYIDKFLLRFYMLYSGSLTGLYKDLSAGECMFGSDATSGSIMVGFEAQALLEITKRAKAGVYVGGGRSHIGMCPSMDVNSLTGALYAGAHWKYSV